MAGRGLLSRLAAGAGNTSRGDDGIESIVAHLNELLNTRKGEAVTAPGFGIIDFADLAHAFPASIQTLQASIRATILEYEPRLKSVNVRYVPDDDPLVVRFEITAQPAQQGRRGSLRFQTHLTAGGRFKVNQ